MTNLFFALFLLSIVCYMTCLIWFKVKKKVMKRNLKTLIVIGSGGHTAEMIKLIKTLNPKLYNPRLYVMADADKSSEYKIKALETEFYSNGYSNYEIKKIPRSRSVHQSYFTSIFTTFYATVISIPIMFRFSPDLILSNGPGTCIPICMIGFIMNTFLFFNIKIMFIESICRVRSLSMSGKILLYFANVVIVQWENLHKKYPQTVFLGRLI